MRLSLLPPDFDVLLGHPEGLAFNSTGDLFVGGFNDPNVYEFTPGGAKSTFGSTAASYGYPYGLAVDSADDLFVADNNTGNIFEFTPGGVRSIFASGLFSPTGMAFNSVGDLFVADDYGGTHL